MTLTRYRPINPLTAFDAFEQEFARAFNNRNADSWQPQSDVEETAGHFVIRTDIPGVEPDKVSVNLDDGVLTIAGALSMQGTEFAVKALSKGYVVESEMEECTIMEKHLLELMQDCKYIVHL